MTYPEPIPFIDGNPYPTPAPPGPVAAGTSAGFMAWTHTLDGVDAGLGLLAGALGTITGTLQGGRATIEGAIAQLQGTPLYGVLTSLVTALQQPNPIGSVIPFALTVPQLPTSVNPLGGHDERLNSAIATYLQQLSNILVGLGGPPPIG